MASDASYSQCSQDRTVSPMQRKTSPNPALCLSAFEGGSEPAQVVDFSHPHKCALFLPTGFAQAHGWPQLEHCLLSTCPAAATLSLAGSAIASALAEGFVTLATVQTAARGRSCLVFRHLLCPYRRRLPAVCYLCAAASCASSSAILAACSCPRRCGSSSRLLLPAAAGGGSAGS